MRCLKTSHRIRPIRSGSNTDSTYLCRQSVGNIVAIQVEGRNNAVFSGAQQDLLQERIRNAIFDDDVFARFRVLETTPWSTIDEFRAELLLRQTVGQSRKPPSVYFMMLPL